MSNPTVIQRFGPPNIYDQYPFGTICNVHDGSIYRQISRDENAPQWERITDDQPIPEAAS
jgi:hypothetical protein